MSRLLRLFPLLALQCFVGYVVAAPAVESFSPQGEVKAVRQATARFATPMVAFGDPRLEAPFAVDCPVPGKGRWADGRNWVYDFDAELPAGVACRFSLRKGYPTLEGGSLAGGESFAFHTGGPAIQETEPREGRTIDEKQVFILGLDAPVQPETVRRHAACQVKGLAERIPVTLLEGAERKAILAQRKDFLTQYYRLMTVDGRSLAVFGIPEQGNRREAFLRRADGPDSPLVVLRCQRPLPNGAQISLVWGAGIAVAGDAPIVTTRAQVLAFRVRPSFEASFNCERLKKDGGCLPMRPMSLNFNAPVKAADARRIRLVDTAGRARAASLGKADAGADYVSQVSFPAPLPAKTLFKLELPAGLKDDAGRPLVNGDRFPLAVRTDEYPPLAKFAARFGIIERPVFPGEKPLLPVTLRNVEARLPGAALQVTGETATAKDELQVLAWLKRLDHKDDTPEGTNSLFEGKQPRRSFILPKPGGEHDFEVVGIPLPGPGFHVVELSSPRLGAALLDKPRPYRVPAAALVTNLAVHFKQGRESSLVWVTRLDKGEPVAGAEVAVRDCGGKVHARGKTDGQGRLFIGKALPARDGLPACLQDWDRQYFVTARQGDDFSFVLSEWNEGLQPWRFNLPQGSPDDAVRAHAVLDRSLFRPGETAHFKVFLRRATRSGFARLDQVPAQTLKLAHVGSDEKFDVPVKWGADGAGTAEWAIPAEARLGTWEIRVNLQGRRGTREAEAGSFRVSNFRVPSMKASLQGANLPLVNAEAAELAVQVNYLSGGSAADLPVRLRGQVLPKSVEFPDFEDFSFANGDVKPGVVSHGVAEDDEGDEGAEGGGEGSSASGLALPVQDFRLGAGGGAKVVIGGLGAGSGRQARADRPRELLAELEYRDPNGEILTSATHLTLWPAGLVVGLKTEGWQTGADKLRLQALVLGLDGKPVAGRAVAVDAFLREFRSHRRRLLGGFYAYEHAEEVKALGSLCEGVSDARGLLVCEVKAPAAGNLILRAKALDGEGNAAVAQQEVSVYGEEEVWRAGSDQDRMDLLPEKKAYEPGETAKFEVRMPFRQATVLVTVEREGVMSSWVQTLGRARPVIEVPVKGVYAPNVFVSVFAVRGRLAKPAATALVDLARPAFRIGTAEIRVGFGSRQLKVSVAADKPVYRVRDKAKVQIQVRRPDGSAPPKGTEVALAAVDEGLLELSPNNSWKLLEAMMKRRGIEVDTATGQLQVVGKRHFGKKALPAGGGGGRQGTRELFDTLLLWQPRLALDAEGRAEVEVPLNDSLTGFRIVAVAAGGTGLFGTGATSIRSSQDLMLVGGLPPLVREQDRFRAGFTVRNASARPLQAEVTARLARLAGGKADGGRELSPIAVSLAPNEAKDIGWDAEAPLGAEGLQWQVVVKEQGGAEGDRLKLTQKVIPAVPVRTLQATLTQVDKPLDMAVVLPAGALPGRGGMRVVLRGKLADELAGVKDYMGAYPYTCLEQQASKAVALGDRKLWDAAVARLPAYLDGEGLAKYFPAMQQGSEVLSAYLLALANEAGWPLPDESMKRMQDGLQGFVEGRVRRWSDLPTADLGLRKLIAIEALTRSMPLEPRWLDSFSIEPNLWPTSGLIDWLSVLKRSPSLAGQAQKLEEAQHILKSRLNFQGSTLNFSTERNDNLWWLMTGADVNANRAILALMDLPGWQADMPRLVTGSLGRQQRGHWNTTVANAWGTLAMARFSERFESVPVAGKTEARLGSAALEQDWAKHGEGASRLLPWPAGGAGTLHVAHQGSGKPWATLQSLAALPLAEPLFTGFRIQRSVSPVFRKAAGRWSPGDVVRVKLDLESLADMGWVAVSDPIPAGATVLGSGLGGDSAILTGGEQKGDWWSTPTFEERSFEGYRAYYRFLPKGKWSVEYTVRLNNPGDFQLPPTRVEAMYAPEMFGELPNVRFVVGQ